MVIALIVSWYLVVGVFALALSHPKPKSLNQ